MPKKLLRSRSSSDLRAVCTPSAFSCWRMAGERERERGADGQVRGQAAAEPPVTALHTFELKLAVGCKGSLHLAAAAHGRHARLCGPGGGAGRVEDGRSAAGDAMGV